MTFQQLRAEYRKQGISLVFSRNRYLLSAINAVTCLPTNEKGVIRTAPYQIRYSRHAINDIETASKEFWQEYPNKDEWLKKE
jgi:hypothetical protein